MQRSLFVAIFCPLALFLLPSTAQASPWTLPAGDFVLNTSFDAQQSNEEFLQDGTRQAYPLNAKYRANTIRFGVRYGFTDSFEGSANIGFSQVGYTADPLILEEDIVDREQAVDSVINFNTLEFGAGDARFQTTYSLLSAKGGLVRGSIALQAKLPTGYDEPAGTFFFSPDGEQQEGGQATLGDGQVDLTPIAYLGASIPSTRTFFRTHAGFRYRFGSPGHQVTGALRIGQSLTDRLILMGGINGDISVSEGEVIGSTVITNEPDTPAREFTVDNLIFEDLRLDRDILNAELGLLVDVDEFEVVVNYQRTLSGNNTGVINSIQVGTILKFEGLTR